MHYLLAVVEGETEKGLIEAFLKTCVGQSPEKYGQIEVVPISVHGNQGYTGLVEAANNCIDDYLGNPDNCYNDEDDDHEKWLVFDYDDIDDKDITLDGLKEQSRQAGFTCVVSKPNIEYFILALLGGYELADNVNPDNYKQEINKLINSLNAKDSSEKTGFTDSIKIPLYDKRIYQCKNCLLAIFSFHPELIGQIIKLGSAQSEKYSEIPILLKRILAVINGE